MLPPFNLELQAPATCSRCGEHHGTWRALEQAESHSDLGAHPASDLRTSARSRSMIGGKAVFNNRHSILDCTVRDVSTTGAKLVFAAPVSVPDEFDLELPQKGRTHRVRVMWRAAERCGVQFLSAS